MDNLELLPGGGDKPLKKKASAIPAAADNVLTAKGNVFTRAQYQQLQQKGLNFKSMKEAADWADVAGKNFIPARDNTTAINPVAPVNQSLQALHNSQKAVAINQAVREKDTYYNPKIIPGITSGDKMVDFLYNHQGLMNVPVLGNIIKNKAYEVAKASSGMETLSPQQLNDIQGNKKIKVAQLKADYYHPGKYDTTYVDAPIKEYKGQDLTEQKKNPINLLDVYFGKKDLPESNYKPTSDYMSFLPSYSIKGDFEKSGNKNLSKYINEIQNNSAAYQGVDPKTLDYMKKPIFSQEGNDSSLALDLGVNLNGHKLNIAYDKDKKLPYISISDAWDFSPKEYALKNGLLNSSGNKETSDRAYIQASLMHKAGKPFKIYDRFYFDPKTKQYIPDEKLNKK